MCQLDRLCGGGRRWKAQDQDSGRILERQAWSVVASPNKGDGGALFSVSCATSTDCVAVGNYETASGGYKTLAELWNGTKWSITPSPNRPSDDINEVSCASSTSCMAVGSYFENGNALTLVESWNGTAWSISPSPSPEGHIVFFDGVSCTSTHSCVAVGSDDNTLIEDWNGTAWSVVASPDKGDGGYLGSVSCISRAKCVAAGYYSKESKTSGFMTKTLIEST